LVAFFYFVFDFGFEGGFEIATLSLAMTGFFLRLHLVAFFYFVFDFWVCGGFEIAALSLAMTGFI